MADKGALLMNASGVVLDCSDNGRGGGGGMGFVSSSALHSERKSRPTMKRPCRNRPACLGYLQNVISGLI